MERRVLGGPRLEPEDRPMRAAFYIVSFILVGVMMAGFIYVIQSRAKRHGAWESPALAMHCAPATSRWKYLLAAS
jgi:hypothetical protein